MKTISKISILLFLIFAITSCALTKEGYISDFSSFVEKVKNKGSEFDKADWEKASIKFEKFSSSEFERFEKEMTPAEKLKVAKLMGQYRALQIKYGLKKLEKNINNAVEKANGFLDELGDTQKKE